MNYVSRCLKGCIICCLFLFFIPVSFAAYPVSNPDTQDENNALDLAYNKAREPFRYKLLDKFEVNGFKLSPTVYFGEARLATGREWALLINKGKYFYAVNQEHISFSLRF